MVIKVSKGEITLKFLTRKLKKQISILMFKGATMDIETGDVDRIPMTNLLDISSDTFKMLCEKIMIEGKEYKFDDLERLNNEGIFTDDDWDLCEEKAVELYKSLTEKKKINSAP